jgi:hypothetical protein
MLAELFGQACIGYNAGKYAAIGFAVSRENENHQAKEERQAKIEGIEARLQQLGDPAPDPV